MVRPILNKTITTPCNSLRASLIMLALWLVMIFSQPGLASTENQYKRKQLESVQRQIKASEQSLADQQQKHQELSDQLQQAEKSIATVARQLNTIRNDKQANAKQLKALTKERATLTNEKQQHKTLLASQIKSLYMTGDHDHSKLLLNQQDPKKFERVIGYYEHLNQARIKNLQRIEDILHRLAQINLKLNHTKNQLLELEQQQLSKRQELEQYQQARQLAVNQSQQQLQSNTQQLEQLKFNEQQIAKALAQLDTALTKAIELVGLSHLKGDLGWPIRGKLRNYFGRKRRGSLRWKGVMIESTEGTPVTTVQQGLVLFADWLKGFGWVIVVDHGKGYMSLYGHNQTLLKTVGEKVEAGEPIALVGKSGGKRKSGLYFELRYQGVAINPSQWCRRNA